MDLERRASTSGGITDLASGQQMTLEEFDDALGLHTTLKVFHHGSPVAVLSEMALCDHVKVWLLDLSALPRTRTADGQLIP